ncbi:MAG: histidine phosphatase family protein [Polyangiaceae bacterium]|nr:histidine phosphatase family protein [Polyangiaceae bacterium]
MDSTIERIVLVRHAKSVANLDPAIGKHTPDHMVPLVDPHTDEEAHKAGDAIAHLALDPVSVCSWTSSFLRCRQTEGIVLSRAFGEHDATIYRRESFLLREQDFGDWDGLSDDEIQATNAYHWEKRRRALDTLGIFYFRYPNGESRADVVERMSIFIGKIHRSRFRTHLIFLHGVTQRAFRMAWMNRSVEWFEGEKNPDNASVLVIERDSGSTRWTDRYIVGG